MTADLRFPRVVMICDATPQPYTGGGATLKSLFAAFPPDSLISIHSDDHLTSEDAQDGIRRFRVGRRQARFRLGALTRALRDAWRLAFESSPPMIQRPDGDDARRPPGLFLSTWVPGFRDLAGSLARHALGFSLPQGAFEEIRRFDPQIIYAWAGDPTWLNTLDDFARRLEIPFLVHFMDNHLELRPEGRIQRIVSGLLRHRIESVIQRSAEVLAISEPMARAYSARFGREIEAFHGVIDTSAWPLCGAERINREGFELLFTGSIEPGQLRGLLDVAQAVQSLRDEGIDIRLSLRLTEYYRERNERHFAGFTAVNVLPHPDQAQLRTVLRQADVLVLAYGFDRHTVDYFRYSFPTKLVPYMLSGTPIIAYGPEAIEPIAYVRRGEFGLVISEPSVATLRRSLVGLTKDAERRKALAARAHQTACREHDVARVAPRFARALEEASRAVKKDPPR